MSGTYTGGSRAAATNKRLYGKDFYKKIGKIGGSRRVPKGFAVRRELAGVAGRKGGLISKRRPADEG